ncbi:palmitoyltransferase ZDHHC1-like [Dendropsophus ebraccatus]|uniref:palmitoyltransferase ZDHHC1-like n=1 Tax=Dendropsophus ebraccatus TaxID=150705 RepID=UPI0038317696
MDMELPDKKRRNGLQRPWHRLQILSWIMYVFLEITAFGLIIPLLPCSWQSAGYGILGFLFSGYFILYLLTNSIDASSVDLYVPVNSMEANKTEPEKMHCHIIPVTFYKEKTRFCCVCQKDVFNFDHHSLIFNTCIGGRNFWFYMNCLVASFLGMTCLAILSLYEFSVYYYQPLVLLEASNSWLIIIPKNILEMHSVVIPTITFIYGVLSLLTAAVLGYYICFRLCLLRQELTMQEYCENRELEKKNSQQQPTRSIDIEGIGSCPFFQYFLVLSAERKSHLYFHDTSMQTEQPIKNNVATQTLIKMADIATQKDEITIQIDRATQTQNEEHRPSSRFGFGDVFQISRRSTRTSEM